ncbi:MAG: heavy-metal-associated domain-containing protein [Campylobacterota bacterium]|nr:heavy-metal-associated domain-containing protein [Campylobacterota bacterium]
MIQTVELKDLNCGGCAATIRTALDMKGFTSVKVNLLSKPHTVSAEVDNDEHFELLKNTLREHDYCLASD